SRDFRESMSVAEQFFASFASLHEESFATRLYGQETLSLELVVKDGLISFYLAVPQRLQELVERQIHSYYPDAHVEPSQEFRMFSQPLHVQGMYLKTDRGLEYPVRTYKSLESDPLNALTNSFSKLPEGMRAGFQLLIQPTNGEWRHKPAAAAKSIAEGKSAKQHGALAALGAVVNAFRGSADEKEKVEAAARLT